MTSKTEPTNVQKLDACISEFTILLPRVADQYQASVKTCIQYLSDVKVDITPADDGRPGQFEDATIKALPLYKKLIELAGEAENLMEAPKLSSLSKIRQRGAHYAFTKAALMVKERGK